MDALTTLYLLLLAIVLAALAATVTLGIRYEFAPRLARRAAIRRLRADVQTAADAHAALPAPRRRHNAHCPECGRFARVTSTGPRGVWTRCKAHGLRLRAIRRVGRAETPLVRVIAATPLLTFDLPPATPPLHLAPPLQATQAWIDEHVFGRPSAPPRPRLLPAAA